MAAQEKKEKSSAVRPFLAGGIAGAVEIGPEALPLSATQSVTYPAEFAKTRIQLNHRLSSDKKLPWPPFGKPWYAGCTTMIFGNSLKAGIRFVAFDEFQRLLQDSNGNISGPRTMMAGFGAGVTESVLAVTPSESIKTSLSGLSYLHSSAGSDLVYCSIDDRKSANPRMRGFLHGTAIIFRERGMRAFFQGFVPTTAKQAANSATRLSSYTMLKQVAQGYAAPGETLGPVGTFGIGGLAGLITVYVTQPLDTIKTRMQSTDAKSQYKNSFLCAVRMFKDEGILTFWSGALARLVRLTLSGGIVFTIYEQSMTLMDSLDPDKTCL